MDIRRRLLPCGAALLSACLLTGCAGLPGTAPRVTLVNLAPVAVELLEQRYLVTVRIQNPNREPLAIEGLDYTLEVNGAEFGSGVSNQRVTIPPYGEKTLELGVTSTIVRLFDQLRRFGDSEGRISYGIRGSVAVSGHPLPVRFSQEGELDLGAPRDRPPGRAA